MFMHKFNATLYNVVLCFMCKGGYIICVCVCYVLVLR